MIVSFYDRLFKPVDDNASLSVDLPSFKLVKRPVEMNDLSCKCEPFSEDIQPTFLIIKDDLGRYIYGSLAGIPLLNNDNQTEINGTDIKSMLSCDVIFDKKENYSTVNEILIYIFEKWKQSLGEDYIKCELVFKDENSQIEVGEYMPIYKEAIYNAWEEMKRILKFYNLYIDTSIDLEKKKIIFSIGQTMRRDLAIRLWEYGYKNYGKWIADVNECKGYFEDKDKVLHDEVDGEKSETWILTSQNKITTTANERDIYPIKRKLVTSNINIRDARANALKELLDSCYNENIELEVKDAVPDFETKFLVYVKRGDDIYKELPCGELHYDSTGLVKFQIGYRYTGIQFI